MKRIIALILLIATLCLSGCTAEQTKELPKPQREEVIIALLDTGISTTAIKSESLLPGHNYVTGTEDTEDRINHGTAVASVILGCESAGIEGAATTARIVPIVVADKVDGKETTISPETLGAAIRDSVDKYGASIVNVSLGTKKDVPELKSAIKYVQKKGALVIAAAGNSGDDEFYYPAAYDGVLTVGSHNKNGQISNFTQQNGTVDILAPGEDIWLASRNGKTYGARGTSYASAYVSAAAVKIWEENPKLSAKDVKKQILEDTFVIDDWKILNLSETVENSKDK